MNIGRFNLVNNGLNPQIYRERGQIIKQLFQEKIKVDKAMQHRVLSYSADTTNNCKETYIKSFPDVPSAYVTYNCSNCKIHHVVKSTITVNNHLRVIEKGFEILEIDLTDYFSTKITQCPRCENNISESIIRSNYQLHIELAICGNLKGPVKKCSLKNL